MYEETILANQFDINRDIIKNSIKYILKPFLIYFVLIIIFEFLIYIKNIKIIKYIHIKFKKVFHLLNNELVIIFYYIKNKLNSSDVKIKK